MLETGTTTVIPSAPPLDRAQPNGVFVKDALYLAIRQAQRGEPAHARAQIKTALVQLEKIDSATERAYWKDQCDLTTNYVEAQAAQAEANRIATQIADEDYVGHQRLTPAEVIDAANENVDLQRALDAKALGGDPTAAYNRIPAPLAKVVATINPEGAASSGLTTQGASLSDLPFRVKALAVAGIAATLLFGLGYVAFMGRAV